MTSIGTYAFSGCKGLAAAIIPNSVTEILNYAYYGCTGLASVAIPGSVKEIGNYAFSGCTGLGTAVSRINNPEEKQYNYSGSKIYTFERIPATATLYVPKGTLEQYRLDKYQTSKPNPWLAFGTVIEVEEGDVNADGSVSVADVTAIYDYLLNSDPKHLAASDVNADGVVSVSDITALYDILLGNDN